jgi:O-acetyl-ADP-ribose deacetylase
MVDVEIKVDDLAFYEGDAVLRPASSELAATTALLRRFEQAAGPELASQLRLTEPLAVGSAIVTGAGRLPVGFLVHAVISSDTEPVTMSTVRRALLSALQRAESWALERVAIPPFGLGAGNLEIEESAQAMIDVLSQHARRGAHPTHVTIVAESEDEATVIRYFLDRSELG